MTFFIAVYLIHIKYKLLKANAFLFFLFAQK